MRVLVLVPCVLSFACTPERYFTLEVTVPAEVQAWAAEDGRNVIVLGADYGGDALRDELAEIDSPTDEPLVLETDAGRGGQELADPDMAGPAVFQVWLAAPGDDAFDPDPDAPASAPTEAEGDTDIRFPERVRIRVSLPGGE